MTAKEQFRQWLSECKLHSGHPITTRNAIADAAERIFTGPARIENTLDAHYVIRGRCEYLSKSGKWLRKPHVYHTHDAAQAAIKKAQEPQ